MRESLWLLYGVALCAFVDLDLLGWLAWGLTRG